MAVIGRPVPCTARLAGDRQTDRQTNRPSTVTLAAHALRGNTRCACAPRVNYIVSYEEEASISPVVYIPQVTTTEEEARVPSREIWVASIVCRSVCTAVIAVIPVSVGL